MKILVVDDHAINRQVLRDQLEAEGFSVFEAADGIEALQVATREPLDAVISDILMPRMDGYRLCHEVRKNPALQHLRFILYSGTYLSPADVQLSGTVGADQFIAKPAPIAIILGALQISAEVPTTRRSELPGDAIVLEQYSAVLVSKLEERNAELQVALAAAQSAHERIADINRDLEHRIEIRTAEYVKANEELRGALAEVKELSGIVPICSYCKKIRNDENFWQSVESYISQHTAAKFSHGMCPVCFEVQKEELNKFFQEPPPPAP